MTELQINKASAFNNGFVVESSNVLNIGQPYYLNITDTVTIINRIYTPTVSGYSIIDLWGLDNLNNTNVCFTLNDQVSECLPLSVNLSII